MENENRNFFLLPSDRALDELKSSPDGLSANEARKRLEKFGPNELPAAKSPGIVTLFFKQFLNPLIYVLIFACAFSFSLGHFSDAIFIGVVLLLNALIGTYQEYGAEKSAQALKNMVSPVAKVVRNGSAQEIDSRDLAPGDIVRLESGDKAPADLRLISTSNFTVDESALTGESLPVSKNESDQLEDNTPVADRTTMCFAGSLISSGRATGVVSATGQSTELGSIAASVGTQQTTKTPLLLRMESFTRAIAIIVLALAALFAIALILKGEGWTEVVVLAIAVAVAAIPEGLPVSITVALAIATRKMAKRKVIVRKLAAVEALGSCTHIASDKTGTLTINEMTVKALAIPGEKEEWPVTGEALAPEGEVVVPDQLDRKAARRLVEKASLSAALCNEGNLFKKDNAWQGHGDSVDLALLAMALKTLNQNERSRWKLKSMVPYESVNQFAATFHQSLSADNDYRLSVKGSFEKVSEMCSTMRVMAADGQEEVEIDKNLLKEQLEALTMKGYRILALAEKTLKEERHAEDELHDLVFLGMTCLMDPARPEAKESIELAQKAGVKALMVTGDHPLTAFSIGRELSICKSLDEVITGSEMKTLDGNEDWITQKTIFARVEPSQKLDIVQTLQERGNFVAVTGDGANDAPALKKAHVGVAMGKRGTDVAKETADLIITDDRFSTIVNGIEEGRIAYANIRKIIYLLTATGAAELMLFGLSVAFNTPIPLLPAQILWLNLVTNGIQDKALAFEPAEGDELERAPRKPNERIFNRLMIERVVLSSLVTGLVSFFWFRHLVSSGVHIDEARNSLLLLLVLFENIMVLNCRSEKKSVFCLSPFKNKILISATLVAQAVHIGAMYVPGLNDVLGISPSALAEWPLLLALALTVWVSMEIYKGARLKSKAYCASK